MKRYIDNPLWNQIQKDFKFLFQSITKSNGELDIRLRDQSFNIYHRGNSLASVCFSNKKAVYIIEINSKFSDGVFDKDIRIIGCKTSPNGAAVSKYFVPVTLLHPFFQEKYLKKLVSNIKKVNYSGELVFEQMLITDNLYNSQLLIIDRQVSETALNRKRMDLLGLQHVKDNKFHFVVLEVKLGNNKELKSDVGIQLNDYINHIEKNFIDWKLNYEVVYKQLKQLCIYPNFTIDQIEIVDPVEGWVVVGHYSGIANQSIAKLKLLYPNIVVKQFWNEFNTLQCVTK